LIFNFFKKIKWGKAINVFSYFALLLVASCHLSDENKLKIAWHNLISRDNIWFHANEKVNAAFESMRTQNADNFEKILPVFPYGTAEQRKGLATEMDEVMKKCSKVISDHKISKWVDDCFYLLGEAQFLKNDYYAAIETFQYLNAKYKTSELRYPSSIWIMKSYVYAGRSDEAEAIVSYYKNEAKWPEKYQGELSAILGDIYIRQEKYKPAISRIRDAYTRTHKKSLKARYSFILGQLYQQTDRGDSATYFFKKCIKYNPNYDMAFSAKMNIAKSANLSDPSKKNQAKRLMKNLLRDDKNISYFDQIYYELGHIEEKDKNLPEAIKYYKLSALSSQKNNAQKSLSYLALADIYFAKPDYKNAQAYYDSTALFIPKNNKDYELIMEKKNVLGELVRNITTIKLQDSLLKLAAMDTNKLYRYLEKAIEDKKSQKEEVDNTLPLNNNTNTTSSGGSGFYFSNSSLVAIGVTEFNRKWGQRKNTDFWRVAAKARELADIQSNNLSTDNTSTLDTINIGQTPLASKASPEMKKMLAQIPFSDASKKSANNKISDAYAGNGDIYYDKLNDIEEAKESYLNLIDKYTSYEKLDRVLYKLYKISNTQNDSSQAEKYKKWLVGKFPKSPYTLLLTSPHKDYTPKETNKEVSNYYNTIYESYLKADYNSAKTQLGEVDKKFPGTSIKPKFDLLDAMIEAKTNNLTGYETKLKLVQSKYPNTAESEKADGLLKALEKLKKGEIDMGDTSAIKKDSADDKEKDKAIKKGSYQSKYSSRYFYVLLVPTSIPNPEEVKIKFSDHNSTKHTLEGLESKLLEFNTTYQLFRVNEFKLKETALKYLLEIDGKQTMLNEAGIKEVKHFIISDENFLELYNTKDYEGYIEFYNKNF